MRILPGTLSKEDKDLVLGLDALLKIDKKTHQNEEKEKQYRVERERLEESMMFKLCSP